MRRIAFVVCVVFCMTLLSACSAKDENISCTISIETNESIILGETTVKFAEGSSVFDILKKVTRENKIQMESRGLGALVYVSGIDNLYEFDSGPQSGWIFYVNDIRGDESSGKVTAVEGDIIKWVYVLEVPPMLP